MFCVEDDDDATDLKEWRDWFSCQVLKKHQQQQQQQVGAKLRLWASMPNYVAVHTSPPALVFEHMIVYEKKQSDWRRWLVATAEFG